jgi:hypothetical protein
MTCIHPLPFGLHLKNPVDGLRLNGDHQRDGQIIYAIGLSLVVRSLTIRPDKPVGFADGK